MPDERGLKHVKLEIKFILVDPEFELKRFNRGYKGIIDLTEAEEMELHITLPLGMNWLNLIITRIMRENIML